MQKKILKRQPSQPLTNMPDYRKCSICGKVKKLDQFYKDKSKLLGRRYGCKECESPKRKVWYQENKEQISEQKKEYYRTKKEYNELIRICKNDCFNCQYEDCIF